MSWQAYVDTSLIGSGNVDKAAIFSAAGDSKWAASHGFDISAAELKTIVDSYRDTKDVKDVQGSGFYIAGSKYMTLRADDRSLYGKKGKEGIIIVKTTQAILVAHYPETVQPGNAVTTVEQLGDYLVGVGY